MLKCAMGEQVLGRVDLAAVAVRLKEARERAGLSAYGLAKLSGMSDTAIYLIEAASRMPSVDTASRLAHALDMTTSELLGERETVALTEPPQMGLARRAAETLGALRLEDPMAFLVDLASLSEDDQAEIAELVQLKASRKRRAAISKTKNGVRILGGEE